MRRRVFLVPLLLASGVVAATDAPTAEPAPGVAQAKAEPAPGVAPAQAPTAEEAKTLSGMSVLGNQEAPKALVLVPWKASELGASVGISTMLDDSRQPVDREVFLRALTYYGIRSDTKP
jgi:hypothetical protein